MTTNRIVEGAHRPLIQRLNRVIVPLVVGVFVVIGVVLTLGLRTTRINVLIEGHTTEISILQQALDREIERLLIDTAERYAADARTFADATLQTVGSAVLDNAQNDLLGDMVNATLSARGDILAMRYITFNGAQWSQVTYDADRGARVDRAINFDSFVGSPTVTALTSDLQRRYVEDIGFQLNPNAPILDRIAPFIRVSVPVAPLSNPATVAGIMQVDFATAPLLASIASDITRAVSELSDRRVLIANTAGLVIFDSATPEADTMRALALERAPQIGTAADVSALADLNTTLNAQTVEDRIVSNVDIALGNALEQRWSIVLIDSVDALFSGVTAIMFVPLIGSVIIGTSLALAIAGVLRRNLRPIEQVSALAARYTSEGGLPALTAEAENTEFGQLVGALSSLSRRVEELNGELGVQQGRYSRSMDVAARISRETAALTDIDALLNRSIELIVQEFGFYHAQVFLVDDIGANAVLTYSHGEIGRALLERRHRLAVGSRTVIGTVTAERQPVVVNDTQGDSSGAPHGFNPLLPDTRAEMALPLISGERVIGALDIQSTQADAFQPDDVRLFQMLADQIAIAIQNVRLLLQSETRIAQSDTRNRQLTRVAWDETRDRSALADIYRYDLLQVETTPAPSSTPPPALTMPITVRGEVIATLDAAAPEGENFTEGDQVIMRAVAERVAIAIENTRLYEETQNTLSETFALYQLSRYLNEAETLEDVLQAITISMMTDAISAQIGVFDEYPSFEDPKWMEITADWTNKDESTRAVKMTGLELEVENHPLLANMQSSQVTLVTDAARDTRLDEVFRAILENTDAQSMALIPFNVRGVWRGVVLFEFPTPRRFTDRDGRLFSALIDQAGVAIDNRMLLRQNEITLSEIERLYTASRVINTANDALDLVRAAVAASSDNTLDFKLALFEGEVDNTGWSKRVRVVARTDQGRALEDNVAFPMQIALNSPLRQREPVVIQDRNAQDVTSPLLDLLRVHNHHFGAVFPLFSANQPIALFIIASADVRDLAEEDYEVYRALTGQMSTVLQNRRLLEQTEQALDETRRLYSASRAIATALDTNNVSQVAIENLTNAAPQATRLSVLLAAPAPDVHAPFLEYSYMWSHTDASDFRVGARIPKSVIDFPALLEEHDETYALLADVHVSLQTNDPLRAILERSGSRSALIVPIQSRLRWFGVIMIESDQPNAFGENYANFVQAVSDQAALAIESLQLFAEAQEQAQRALALAEAGQLASDIGGELVERLERVFEEIARPANYDRWLLALLDDDGRTLRRVIQRVPTSEAVAVLPETYDIERDNMPLTHALRLGHSLLVNEPRSYPAFVDSPDDLILHFGKHLVEPIRLGERQVGVLVVGRALNAPDLGANDEQLTKTLAAQVAVAVENRRLFEEAEGGRSQLSAILTALPTGVIVLDARTLRPTQYNDQAERLLGMLIDLQKTFDAADYGLFDSTGEPYSLTTLPINRVLTTGRTAVADDLALFRSGRRAADILMNAAPIKGRDGDILSIIVTVQDISALRNLERTLEINLQNTMTLYDATRGLAEAIDDDQLLDQIILQMRAEHRRDAFVLLLDEDTAEVNVMRSTNNSTTWTLPDDLLNPFVEQFIWNVSEEPELAPETRQALSAEGIEALFSLPLRARSRDVPLGWLVITFDQVLPLAPETQQFFTTLRDNAAVSLDNRNLLRSTEGALRETETLYSSTNLISRAGSLEGVITAIEQTLDTLSPDIYAAYITADGQQRELFNISLDAPPTPFGEMIETHNLQQHTTIFIDDLRGFNTPAGFEADLLKLGNVRGFGFIQIRLQDRPAGGLIVAYHQPHRFSASEARFLTSLSDTVSVVLDNQLLLERVQVTLDETNVLYQSSRALSDANTVDDILDVIITYMLNRPVSQVFIVMLEGRRWDAPDALATIVSAWHADPESILSLAGVSMSSDQFPAWRLLGTEQVLMIDNVQTSTELDEMERVGTESLDLHSLSVLPLRIAGRSIGCVVIGSRETYQHSERDLRVYRSFAEQASLRLEASRLLEQTERRARQLATSSEVSRIAGSILDLNYLLPRIVDLIKDAFNYDHAQVFLMDEEDDYAVLRASTGEAGRQLLGINHKLQKGSASVIGQVTSNAAPAIALDTADARVVHRPNPYLPNTRSEMAVPLILKGRVIGALDVQSNFPNAFDEDDITVLTTLAGQIATAIDNAQLFDQSRARAAEMAFLFSVTTAAASAETLNDAIQSVSQELLDALEALSVSIYLPQTFADALNEELIVLQAVATAGLSQALEDIEDVLIDDPDHLIAQTARARQPMIIENIARDTHYQALANDARSAIIMPLTTGAQLIGVIVMESDLLNAFTSDTLTLLRTLSGTLSAIVQNQQLLEQVQRSNEQLLEVDRIKTDFLANMSHELRTPLNSIIGFSRVILKGIDGPLTEMQEQDLTTIYNSGMHLLNLINDILDQAKIAAGKMDLQFDHFEIKPVIDGVRSIGIGLVKDKPIDIYVDLAAGLPSAYGDEFRTRQVLLNLVSNATKFTREGMIKISAYPVDDSISGHRMIRIDVTDTGIGIADKDLPLLFEAFRQVDSSLTRTQGGTGLGLPIAKSLVEMQGGRMMVNSVVNSGSTFSILVPTERVMDTPEQPRKKTTDELGSEKPKQTGMLTPPPNLRETEEMPLRAPMLTKRQILVIEDNPDMVDQFRRALQREGFDVFAASIPLEAEAMASGLHPTLIVMDVNFSNGAGWDILTRLKGREDTIDIPVVIVSLSSESERALATGAFRFIRRPFAPDDLVEAVREAERESRVDRILIIDDQPEHVRLIEQLLADNGDFRVFSAPNGMEGISLVARRRPDLVILDLRMPEMDGFAVVQELRNNPETATIPILVVTGDTLSNSERDQLHNLAVLHKTDISSETYRHFMDGVRTYLEGN